MSNEKEYYELFEQEKRANNYFDDKFLCSREIPIFETDERGLPKIRCVKSSALEYFLKDRGWVSASDYEAAVKGSTLSAEDFNREYLEQIHAAYIDTQGRFGRADMSVQDYDLLLKKTYSPLNAAAYDEAKKLYTEHLKVHPDLREDKPIECYAFEPEENRTSRYNTFSVIALSATDTVTTVYSGLKTNELQNILYDIYELRKSEVSVLFTHPHQLYETAYESGCYDALEHIYKIEPIQKQYAAEGITHTLNRYTNSGDIDACLAYGDYWQCNYHLSNILKMHEYGYSWDGMEPIFTAERALDLIESGEEIYMLYDDNTESLAETNEQIKNYNGIFGRERKFPNTTPLFLSETKEVSEVKIINTENSAGRK